MCFTGGFALAMMVDSAVAAPVVAQPLAPFAITPGRSRDLNLSPADLDAVKQRAAAGCEVWPALPEGLRLGKRFETLTREIGDKFIRVEFPGRKHRHSPCTATRGRGSRAGILRREAVLVTQSAPSATSPPPA